MVKAIAQYIRDNMGKKIKDDFRLKQKLERLESN